MDLTFSVTAILVSFLDAKSVSIPTGSPKVDYADWIDKSFYEAALKKVAASN
jgi:hypothetical protein